MRVRIRKVRVRIRKVRVRIRTSVHASLDVYNATLIVKKKLIFKKKYLKYFLEICLNFFFNFFLLISKYFNLREPYRIVREP